MKRKIAYQFKIELLGTEPLIWRQIEVPSTYSFWDLHVAIQDAMGWLDCHLHGFRLLPAGKKKPVLIGIANDDFEDNTLAGWEVPLKQYFCEPGDEAGYEYDFGDGWDHRIVLEGMHLQQEKTKYPRCVQGERACPPEDCGGIPGYYNLLEILGDPTHEEHEDMKNWLGNHAKNYLPDNLDYFDPKKVRFLDPKKRLKEVLRR